jgi:light-regulated signal transduction histidine kinase (bacteriophytochrome)
VFVLTAAVVAAWARVAVLRPMHQLRTGVRRVAAGEFGHRVPGSGPADLRELAGDVEAMRERIVQELGAVERARLQLEQQAMELRRSNAELEQFAYVASHDLQEPLRKIASFCQMLQRRYGDQLDERAQRYIEFAVDGAKRMQTLITDLLVFSRVGRMYDQITEVDLDDVTDRALNDLSRAVEESGAVVRRGDLPTVTGEPTLLRMLMQNLIGNAVKFADPDRPPHVRIAAEQYGPEPAGSGWEITVEDNGIGIPPEFADKVFIIFQRLHARDSYPGTGIGLALCKKIVEYHGGRIWLDTGFTDGARVRFTLPVDGGRPFGVEAPSDAASPRVASLDAAGSADPAPGTASDTVATANA